MKKLIVVGFIALAGCASANTGIVQISDDTYMYAKQDWAAYSGGVIKAELYMEGNTFCAGKGKKFVPVNSTAQDYGLTYANAEIQFSCK